MRTITVDPQDPDAGILSEAADVLMAGGLVAFPTETVYGLGALALDSVAASRIFAAKGRPADDPLIVHVRPHWDLELVFSEVTDTIRRLTTEHWPGPLTIVAPKQPAVPDIVTSGRPTVAVRAPRHPVAALLLDLVGAPIAAPSANRFSYLSPTSAAHVAADLREEIDVLVDGGPSTLGIESTIVGVDGDRLTLLRPGSIQIPEAREDRTAPASAAPGRLEVHYAPATATRSLPAGQRLGERDEGGVLIGYDDSHPAPPGWTFVSLGDRSEADAVAQRFYEILRRVDATEPDMIVIELTGRPGVGAAIDDRIRRASGGQSVY